MKTRDGVSKAVWLCLLEQGGRWSAAELCKFLPESSTEVYAVLNAMSARGYVQKYRREPVKGSRVRFGIHARCKVPVGVSLTELSECGAVTLTEPA